MTRIITPSHTCGPLFGFAILPEGLARATDAADPEAIFLSGMLRDSVTDLGFEAFLEICAPGQMVRVRTHAGRYEALLKRPAPEALTGTGPQAPHFTILVHARGITRHLMTRAYLPGHDAAFAADPVAGLVPDADRPALLMQQGADPRHFTFDICLRGAGESVFFEL